jgi:hypothetical protein
VRRRRPRSSRVRAPHSGALSGQLHEAIGIVHHQACASRAHLTILAILRRRPRLVPKISSQTFDVNLAQATTLSRSATQNRTASIWQNRSKLATFVRYEFGSMCDGSEVRNSVHGERDTALSGQSVTGRHIATTFKISGRPNACTSWSAGETVSTIPESGASVSKTSCALVGVKLTEKRMSLRRTSD